MLHNSTTSRPLTGNASTHVRGTFNARRSRTRTAMMPARQTVITSHPMFTSRFSATYDVVRARR